ncbi:MAG: hypothetical protein KBT22_00870 [Bacteroidales bacterium]|nr:hypothetical protein [Candidatus Scybalocola fimicaballi]
MKIEIKTKEQHHNDLFFVCSLVEYIARKTKNDRGVIVNALGEDTLTKLYNLADVYHCENIDKVSDELITEKHISRGNYDNISGLTEVRIPTHFDIGKVYERLISTLSEENESANVIQILIEVFSSWIARKIDNYRSSTYYENNSYLTASYRLGHIA